eukprot:1157490-Pelagomonas_calceolata.AAC.2
MPAAVGVRTSHPNTHPLSTPSIYMTKSCIDTSIPDTAQAVPAAHDASIANGVQAAAAGGLQAQQA